MRNQIEYSSNIHLRIFGEFSGGQIWVRHASFCEELRPSGNAFLRILIWTFLRALYVTMNLFSD